MNKLRSLLRPIGTIGAAVFCCAASLAAAQTPVTPGTPSLAVAPATKSAMDQYQAAERDAGTKTKVRLRTMSLPTYNVLSGEVTSYTELRFRGIVRQTFDLSCGAAALATLIKGYFGIDVDESGVIKDMLENASTDDAKNIATNGFSMLELKRYAESRGLIAGGFRSNKPEELRKLRAPVVALINSRGYNHFVVIRHVRGDEVAVADPVFGNRTETLKQFAKRWNNVILVIVSPGRVTNAAFMEAPKGASDPRAVQLFLSRSYSPALSYGPGDFY
jgi:predicted double-glycine peptidase